MKEAEKRVGFTAGAFDLFHAGHVVMLQECKEICDYLLVGIETDPSLDRPWKNKPIQSLVERQIQVKGCKYVDETIVYQSEAELEEILSTIDIDVRIMGDEPRDHPVTGMEICEKRGIEIYRNKRYHNFGSGRLKERVRETK